MKILLIQPPAEDYYDTGLRLLPLGLAYLKGALLAHVPGVEVRIIDFRSGRGRRTLSLPKELEFLVPYYSQRDSSPFSTFHNYYRFGADYGDIAREVADQKPDLVGISSLFSAYHGEVIRTAEAIGQLIDVPVVVGGAHASACPQSLLLSPAIDFAILKEGERPIVELARALMAGGDLSGVPNLVHKRGGEFIYNPLGPNFPLDELPLPDLSDFAPGDYRLGRLPLTPLITSRGCPRECSFCSTTAVFSRGFAQRSAKSVLDELELRFSQGYRAFDFEDDNLCLRRGFIEELCRGVIDRLPVGEISLQAMNGISHQTLDPGVLALMRRAGFSHLNLSLVSQASEVLARAERGGSAESFASVVQSAFGLGFRIVAYQILGLPYEELSSMVATQGFLARLPVLMGPSPFYLAPGSPASLGRSFTRAELARARLTAMGTDAPNARREEVFTLFVASRILNFLKGLDIPQEEMSLAQALAFAGGQDARTVLGAQILERLLREEVLYAATPQGLMEVEKFIPKLFFEVLREAGFVATQTGRKINLPL